MADNVSRIETCGNCQHNDDCLCDQKGILVQDDDEKCKYYEPEKI